MTNSETISKIRKIRAAARAAYKTGGARPFEVGATLKQIDDIATELLKPDAE